MKRTCAAMATNEAQPLNPQHGARVQGAASATAPMPPARADAGAVDGSATSAMPPPGVRPGATRGRSRVRKAVAAHPLSAYVLHQYDWSESSLIVELFTRAQGRVVVVAKGAKRPTSNFRPLLLPFLPLQLVLGKPPKDDSAEVLSLRSAEWSGGVPMLPPRLMLSGFYLNELLLKLLARQDPHPQLFDAFADTLVALALASDDAPVLRAFELQLLRELGLLPDLACVTATAQPLLAQARYTVHPERGLMPEAGGAEGSTWLNVDGALAMGDMAQLRQACSPAAATLRQPLRALLHYHLGQRPLRTRQVWQGVQRLIEPAR
jgi:DNA repair protein RecO (recombination protein O)